MIKTESSINPHLSDIVKNNKLTLMNFALNCGFFFFFFSKKTMILLFFKLFTLGIKTLNLLLLFVKLLTLGIKTINMLEPQVISLVIS